MIFTYWTGSEINTPPSATAWQERYPAFKVFGDQDVLPFLDSPLQRDLYDGITLPAGKSDIARLVLLRAHGGLYLDAHTAPADGDRLAETIEALSSVELILFSKLWMVDGTGGFNLMNTVLAARRHSPLLDALIGAIFTNLRAHREAEDMSSDYVPYNLFKLTGTMVFLEQFFEQSEKSFKIIENFKQQILVHGMKSASSPGFEIYRSYGYRKPGQHWSERQQHERLFKPHSR